MWILFLIYICDIGKDLIANILVNVDDTKVKQKVVTIEDVEKLQVELAKLDKWAKDNNMEFNKKKFQVMRYGQNEELKNSTTYFAGNYDEVIDRYASLRDLGIQLSDDGTFEEHIENICKKARQKCGWLMRTFYNRNCKFMKEMFNSLVQPHLDYCCGCPGGEEHGAGRKGAERFHQEDPRVKRTEVSREVWQAPDEFTAEEAGALPDALHLEGVGGAGA